MVAGRKSELRRWARRLAPVSGEEAAQVCDRLRAWLLPRRESRVLTYLAMEGEVNVEPLVAEFPGTIWLTTRTPAEGWLSVHPIESRREVHRFGFEQPQEGSPTVSPREVDIAFVPGLLFDPTGGRLGHGAGYYDELLSRLRPDAVKVGVSVTRFIVETLPVAADDVRMDWLATENGVQRV